MERRLKELSPASAPREIRPVEQALRQWGVENIRPRLPDPLESDLIPRRPSEVTEHATAN